MTLIEFETENSYQLLISDDTFANCKRTWNLRVFFGQLPYNFFCSKNGTQWPAPNHKARSLLEAL